MNAVQQASEIVRNRLASGMWAAGQKMPNIAELAGLCSVSVSTMWRALGPLKRESLIHARRGGAIVAGPAGIFRPEADFKGPAWQRLKNRIGQEILIGPSLETELPPINKMANRYGVAIDTCKKALNGLVAEGVIVRKGRRFHKAYGRSKAYRSGIVLIAAGDSDKGISILEPRIEHVVESFERECFRLGYSSRCEGYNVNDASALIKTVGRLNELDPVAGFLLSLWNPGTEVGWNRWIDLLRALLSRGKPVIVLDQDGGLIFPKTFLAHAHFRVLRIAGVRAGMMVGRLLLRYGHRHVCFLMPFARSAWAQNRFTGLLQCYRQYGGPTATVEAHFSNENVDTYDMILAILGLNEKQIHALYGDRFSQEELNRLAARIHTNALVRLKEKIPADLAAQSTRFAAKFVTALAGRAHDQWVYNTLLETLEHISSNISRDRYVPTFLDDVLRKSSATAWVCAEDKTALNAVSFLQGRGKRVPEDISVIGFENYRESHEQNISTLDFNMNGMVQQGLLMIADPQDLKNKPMITEVDGYIVDRRTIRK